MTDTPTPRTDALTARMAGELDRPMLASNHVIELCEHARDLERDLTACRAALRELLACKDAPRTAPMVGIHDYACPCTRLGKKSGPCKCLGKAAEARIGQAWSAARAILQSTGEGEGKP